MLNYITLMIHESPEYKLLRLTRTSSAMAVQNAFLRAPVREIAMTLVSYSRDEQREILQKIPDAKRKATDAELAYQSRLRSTVKQRREMVDNLTRRLLGDNPNSIASYVRPSSR